MKAFLTDADRQKITDMIRAVEARTSGELVTVVARASDAYHFIPLLWAALLALTVPMLGLVIVDDLTARDLYSAQLLVCIVLAAAFRWPPLKIRLIPTAVKRLRAARAAREQFYEQGVHRADGQTGILIFVSVAERYVEVLADAGIDAKVDASVWQGAVDDFVASVKAGKIADGFVAAIEDCGAVLVEHFPGEPGNENELPNRLIEI